MQSNLSVILDDHVSATDCSIIANAINEENKKKPHMIATSTEDLLENVRKYGGLVARTLANDLVWFVKLTLLSPEYNIWMGVFDGSPRVPRKRRMRGSNTLNRRKI